MALDRGFGMVNAHELPLVVWVVPCFDKRKAEPLPVYNRMLFLDWSRLSTDDTAEVLAILNAPSTESRHSPVGLGTTVVEVTRMHDVPDWRMLKFRQHFVEATESERDERFQQVEHGRMAVAFVQLNAEYAEDEKGNAMTVYEMIQHVSGQVNPIILGDYTSITRLGPTPPKEIKQWSQQKADTIAHFLDVVCRIKASSWYRNPQSITYVMAGQSEKGSELTDAICLEALFPNDEQTVAVLGYFRQLHAGDKLLLKACDTYIVHCGDDRKACWIRERRQAFAAMVDAKPTLFEVGHTRREIVQMFMYGARLLHASSNHGDEDALAQLIASRGRYNAVSIFNHCLWDFLMIAAPVCEVIRQDYDSWIADHGLQGPRQDSISTLFQGKSG
jgi:hypothetical protein